ncbi:serine-rich adhesin for platelets [Aplysia californica]|uniref:Serine-rich adhesin for platelets n=1 Tax=Aplysia californica TaxID=6500 RepID=A0ABM1A8T6_APLCA|nr:serine-rich adhesin for platelets [Aplysia californica]
MSSPISVASDTSMFSIMSLTSMTTLTSGTSSEVFCLTDCAGFPNGRYPDCNDCANFYICPGGGVTGTLNSCATGLLFSPTTLQCALPGNVVCSTTSATSITSVTSEQSDESQTSLTTNTSPESDTSVISQQSLTSLESLTSTTVFCLSFSSTVCSDKSVPAGDYQDCSNCQLYVRCSVSGESSSGDCGSYLLFNPDTGLCDIPGLVTCSTTSASSPTSVSSQTSEISAYSPTSLTSQASLTSETSVTSATSSVTSQTSLTSMTSDTSQTSFTSVTSTEVFCVSSCVNVPTGDWPDCSDCQNFYRCDGSGSGSVMTCLSILLFNGNIQDCDVPANVVCSTTSASSVTSLESPVSESKSSATSLTSQESVTSKDIYCINSCTSIPFGRWANCESCETYYQCNGADGGSLTSCVGGLLFNSDTTACDMPENVVCATTSASSETSVTSVTSQTSFTPSLTSETSVTSVQSGVSQQSITSGTSATSQVGTRVAICMIA